MACCCCHMRSRELVNVTPGADATDAPWLGLELGYEFSQRRKPTAVANDAIRTIAATDAPSCGSESSQLRLIQSERKLLLGGRAGPADSAKDRLSASMILRIRSHKAFSFGGALYWPRCVWQKLMMDCRSLRTSEQFKHCSKCMFSVDLSSPLRLPSSNSPINCSHFSQFIVLNL